MIQSFRDGGTEDLYNGRPTKAARKICPPDLAAVARRKLDQLDAAETLDDLRVPRANRLEALRGNRRGQHSIRVNDRYRICFIWTSQGATQVEMVDYH